MQQFTPRSPEQARQWLEANGITVSAFARQNGVDRSVVHDLLRGRSQGKYGESHKAAIALGLKAPPNECHRNPNRQKLKGVSMFGRKKSFSAARRVVQGSSNAQAFSRISSFATTPMCVRTRCAVRPTPAIRS
ncbi:DNA-binding protein [Xanthomonas hortorum pv. pelargonii]|nr:DNA-binding protein [Xanthomonas hortorum pv. pelargonii]